MKNNESLVKCRFLYIVLWLVGLWFDISLDSSWSKPVFDVGGHVNIFIVINLHACYSFRLNIFSPFL